jgi:multidrug efflux system outer membrane protein
MSEHTLYYTRPRRRKPLPLGRTVAHLTVAFTLAGCAVHSTPLDRPDEPLLDAFSAAVEDDAPHVDRWWESFGDPALVQTVDAILTSNPNLAAAWARVEQADLSAEIARAGWFPTIDLELSASRNRTFFPPPINSRTANRFNAALQAGYEVDLWGRVRSQQDAARLDIEASATDYDALALSLAAEAVEAWLDLQTAHESLGLLDAQIETNERYLELVLLRLGLGQGTALDVYQMRQTIEAQHAQRPLLHAQRDAALLRLAALGGSFTLQRPELAQTGLPALPPLPALGVPVDLLDRRPDVRAAWLRAVAADRRVAVALADRLPALRLSGTIGNNTEVLSTLFDDFIWGLTAGLTAPLFDAGRRRAEVDRNRAIVAERIATWRNTLVGALRETEDALLREREQTLHLQLLDQQLLTARAAVDSARDQYRNGLVDYLRVLNALTVAQSLEQERVNARRTLLTHRVNLYRSLGGAWQYDDAPAASARREATP